MSGGILTPSTGVELVSGGDYTLTVKVHTDTGPVRRVMLRSDLQAAHKATTRKHKPASGFVVSDVRLTAEHIERLWSAFTSMSRADWRGPL